MPATDAPRWSTADARTRVRADLIASHMIDARTLPEQWADISGWEGLYQASSAGRVRSLPRGKRPGRILKPKAGKYLSVKLSDAGIQFERQIHKLVLEAFGPPNLEDYRLIRHLNSKPHDNNVWNLAWGSDAQNHADDQRAGTRPTAQHGTDSKYSTGCNCRPCLNAHAEVSRARRSNQKETA